MTGYHGLVEGLRAQVVEIATADLASRLEDVPVLIDIREPDEVRTGFIPGAVHVPRGVLEGAVERLPRDTEVVLYCSHGNRSILAAASMQAMGFTAVASLAGGSVAWRMGGHPVTMPGAASETDAAPPSTTEDSARYARQVTLPEIGAAGQEALGKASVLVVGAGGLGSPVSLYLAAAGVGRLVLVDPDVVDVSNLHRQIVHDTTALGRRKVASAADHLRRLNPGVVVEAHPTAMTASTALDLAEGCDVIVDTTDSFPARYLLNDLSVRIGLPLVHGSVFRFEGQVSVFDPTSGPCYRCLFPSPPPPELAPNCAVAGVLGSITGIIGSLQATEVLKLITRAGEPLIGTLLHVDTLLNRWSRLRFDRSPDCPTCSDGRRPPELVDYDPACRPSDSR